MVFPCARFFRAPIWCPSGGGGTRDAGSTVAESLATLYRVGTHQIRRGGWMAARSSTSQVRSEPLCARIRVANQEVSENQRSVFFLRRPTRSGERASFVGLFQGYTELWTAGCWLARQLHQLKASIMDLGNLVFRVSV